MKKERNSSFELLRIICMLWIVALHMSTQSGISSYNTPILKVFYLLCRNYGRIACNVFTMIGAYFLVDCKFEMRRITKIWFTLITYSVPLTLLCIYLPVEITLTQILQGIFPFYNNTLWYGSTYILLLFISPMLNLLLHKLDEKHLKTLIIIYAVMVMIYPTFTMSKGRIFNNEIYAFILDYLAVGYMKKRNIFNDKKKILRLCGIVIPLIIVALRFICATKGLKDLIFYQYLEKYLAFSLSELKSLPNFLSALGIFSIAVNLHIGNSKIINRVGGATFGVYVIHQVPVFYTYLWNGIFTGEDYKSSEYNLLYACFMIAAVFLVCSVIELIRAAIFKNTVEKSKKYNQLMDWFNSVFHRIEEIG